ncbi:MAG: hypothetical protein KJ718_04010 [Nanoarchaeota archaeon]|nr:hypothetical protein [Nanoarchaeota archaeon]MBU1051693.1 hypothetical protein [Nanoarchaeota archaeon]
MIFKKIASALASSAMLLSTVGLAAATTYPDPFVTGGVADVAIVYGSHPAATNDLAATLTVQESLNGFVVADTTTGVPEGGDYVLLAKSSDNLNLNNNWGVFTGSIDNEDLSTLLADGTYTADDNDDFAYEQSITVGSPTFEHFRDSDYESEVGLDERTPTLGFKLSSDTWVVNYTLDFTSDAESDVASSELEDFEGSDLHLMGKDYYISDFDNSSSTGANAIYHGKLTLLDSANAGIVNEGETETIVVSGTSYEVNIISLTTTQARLTINGETTDELAEGESFKLSDGSYLGVKNIFQRDVTGVVGNVEFSIGSGKLEITSGSEIKLNDATVTGVKGYVHKGTGSGGSEKIDKIVVEWITDDEVFLSPESDLVLPGFETLKFTMNDFVRSEEEKILLEKDGDNSMEITLPIKDGTVSFNLLYNSATTGNFTAIGKAADERLATSDTSTLTFYQKHGSADMDKWFVATYNISAQAESYLLRATVRNNTDASSRAEATIEKDTGGSWVEVCKDKTQGSTCNIGLVSFTLTNINHSTADKSILITATGNTNFHTIYTVGGLKIWLPVNVTQGVDNQDFKGSINLSSQAGKWVGDTGNDVNTWFLHMQEEDYQDNIASGVDFNMTIDDTTSTNNPLQVSQVNGAGTGGSATSETWGGLEQGDSTSVYEAYMKSDVGARILHYTKPDEDYVEVYYPTGDSESYAEVYLTESGTTSGSSGTNTIGVPVTDAEATSYAGKSIVVIGGSCVNTVAAQLLGSSTPMCGDTWTTATGVGVGQYLVQTFARTGDKVATIVAGYAIQDTATAATALTTQTVDTTVGMKYTGSTAEDITSVLA